MIKFVCESCGHTVFSTDNFDEIVCRCGQTLTKANDKKSTTAQDGFIDSVHKHIADAVLKISLLKREIDKCLDERNKEKFKKVSSELSLYEEIVNTCTENPEFHWH